MQSPKRLSPVQKKAVLHIRAILLSQARKWLADNGFVEIQGPVIIPAIGRPACAFELSYFNNKAFLSHGLQPYTDAFTGLFGKIYTIQPFFRAEKTKTNRHLAEFWRIELAASNMTLTNMLSLVERLVDEITTVLVNEASQELKLLGRSTEQLAKAKVPFERLTYDEAIKRLQQNDPNVHWGEELEWSLENRLSLLYQKPFFITDYPVTVENQFFKRNPKIPELSLVADLMAPEGYGEMGSGGETGQKKDLLKKMQEDDVDTDIQQWYSELKSSRSENTGFAIGIERLIQWVCGLTEISQATLFPRAFESMYP